MGDGVEDDRIVVAHVRRAVGASLEVGGRGQHREVEAVSLAEPAGGGAHGLEPFLVTDGDAPKHLPVEERAERANPGLVAESGEGFADAHHVRFGDTDVQRPALIDRCDAGFEPARGRKIRVD